MILGLYLDNIRVSAKVARLEGLGFSLGFGVQALVSKVFQLRC